MHSRFVRLHREHGAPCEMSQCTLAFWHGKQATFRSFRFLRIPLPWEPFRFCTVGSPDRRSVKASSYASELCVIDVTGDASQASIASRLFLDTSTQARKSKSPAMSALGSHGRLHSMVTCMCLWGQVKEQLSYLGRRSLSSWCNANSMNVSEVPCHNLSTPRVSPLLLKVHREWSTT